MCDLYKAYGNGSVGAGAATSRFCRCRLAPTDCCVVLLCSLLSAWLFAESVVAAPPPNVILFIGDGMGAEAIEAGRYFANGDTEPLFMETLPYSGLMTHNEFSGGTTDSAAGATALATGHKVANGVISVQVPGSGSDLTTVLEIFQAAGKRAGLVTTDTAITDASPAAFAAHNTTRNNQSQILDDYFNQTRPNVLFGAPGGGITPSLAASAGYDVVLNQAELFALDTETTDFVSGQFNFGSAEAPTLAAMTTTALNILDNEPDGFFLMVEHEDTDEGAHANNISRVVNGVVELDQAVRAAFDWRTTNSALSDTLIIVTADHETGGLNTISNNGAGNLPGVTWSTTGHTPTPVPVVAAGPPADAGRVQGLIDNTDVFYIMTSTIRPETVTFQQRANDYTGVVDTFLQQADGAADNSLQAALIVDAGDPDGSGNRVQALLRFEDIFGDQPGQIPADVEIQSATLELRITTRGDSMQLHRLLTEWSATDTWNSFGDGVQADDTEAATSPDSIAGPIDGRTLEIDVTESLTAWQRDPDSNFGWVFLPTGENGVHFIGSSSGSVSSSPKLTVNYVVPEPSTHLLGIVVLALVFRRRNQTAPVC